MAISISGWRAHLLLDFKSGIFGGSSAWEPQLHIIFEVKSTEPVIVIPLKGIDTSLAAFKTVETVYRPGNGTTAATNKASHLFFRFSKTDITGAIYQSHTEVR